jgi:hypothetical protein
MSRLSISDWQQPSILPSDNDSYLVYTLYGQIFVAKYNPESKEWTSNDFSFAPGNLTHWHKLPENPK